MRVTVVRALLAACLAVLALAQAAAAASPEKLLTKHQPVTVFTPLESFRPTTVETFVADSNLETFTGSGWIVIDPTPSVDSLPGPGSGLWRLNQRVCSLALGLAGLACYASAWSGHAAPSVVYGRVVSTGDKTVLQYWYFYYDNFYSYTYPPSDFIWQAHEGDWEVVNVVLSAEDEEPLFVGYSQHCLGETRDWAKVPRWRGRHPVVFVAIGSHANYLEAGTHAIDTRCIPPQAVALLQQFALPLPVDFTGEGDRAGPRRLREGVTSILRVTQTSPAWITFPGFWGELQYFHAPTIGTVPFGVSPVGPAFHAVWQDPLGTLARWPAG